MDDMLDEDRYCEQCAAEKIDHKHWIVQGKGHCDKCCKEGREGFTVIVIDKGERDYECALGARTIRVGPDPEHPPLSQVIGLRGDKVIGSGGFAGNQDPSARGTQQEDKKVVSIMMTTNQSRTSRRRLKDLDSFQYKCARNVQEKKERYSCGPRYAQENESIAVIQTSRYSYI